MKIKNIIILSIMIFFIILLKMENVLADSKSGIRESLEIYPRYLIPNDIVRPNPEYPVNSKVVDSATISAATFFSMNDIASSFYKYTTEESRQKYWAQAAVNSYTLLDWRQFRVGNKNNTKDIFKVDLSRYGGLTADPDTKRAVGVLGNRALIFEDIDMKNKEIWNDTDLFATNDIKKSIAIMAIYRAIGIVHETPPLISFANLDGISNNDIDTGKKPIIYTSLASLDSAQRYAFYDVWVKDAEHFIYQSPNMLEGYLWEAIQDGLIAETELTQSAKNHIINYVNPTVSHGAVKPFEIITPEYCNRNGFTSRRWTEEQPMLLYYVANVSGDIQGGESSKLIMKVNTDIQAFKDEKIMLIDFLGLVAKVMDIKGEAVLTISESQTLTAAYGSKLPGTMSDEYYNNILYLVARGIIDDSYINKLYLPLRYNDMMITLSRVADKDSRLTYKYVTIPFDIRMAENGFIPVEPIIDNIKPLNVEMTNQNSRYYDILVERNPQTEFLNSNNQPIRPFISKSDSKGIPAYGVLIDDNAIIADKIYYHFKIYEDEPIPTVCEAKEDVGEIGYTLSTNYYLFAPDSTKTLTIKEALSGDKNLADGYGGIIQLDENNNMVEISNLTNAYFGNEYKILNRSDNGFNYDYSKKTQKVLYSSLSEKSNSNNTIVKNNISSENEELNNKITTISFQLIADDIKTISIANQKYTKWNNLEDNQDVKVTYIPDTKKDRHNFIIELKGEIRDNPSAIISQLVKVDNKLPNDNLAYIRRGHSTDIYYCSKFLEKNLEIRLEKISDISYNLVFPDNSIQIKKNKNGWMCYSQSSIVRFTTNIPAIEISEAENESEEYFIHGLIIEHYLRSNFKDGWSQFITTDGIVHISLDNTDITLKASPSTRIQSIMDVTGTVASHYDRNLVFKDEANSKVYLDLQNVPSYLSNFIIVWDVKSSDNISAGIISLYPTGIFGGSLDSNILDNILDTDINLNTVINESIMFKYTLATPIIGNLEDKSYWTKNKRIVSDTKKFMVFYELLNSSSNLKDILSDKNNDWEIPYVYSKEADTVFFVNLPLIRNKGKVSVLKSDVIDLISSKDNALKNSIISIADDSIDSSEKAYIPVAILPRILNGFKDKINKLEYNNKLIIVGPYQVWLSSDSQSSHLKMPVSLPLWAIKLYGNADKILKSTLVYQIKLKDFAAIIPYDNKLIAIDNSNIEKTDIKLNISPNDTIGSLYTEEKKFREDLNNTNQVLSYLYIFCIVVIPYILIGLLILILLISLMSNWKIMKVFCTRWFDPWEVLSFGKTTIYQINIINIFISCTLGIIFLYLLSQGYFTVLLLKILVMFE